MNARKQALPAFIGQDGELVVRAWTANDAEDLQEVVSTSIEHLRPWMPWASQPLPSLAERRGQIAAWERRRLDGGDGIYGIFVGGVAAGGCGLHWRIEHGGIEIGYWVAASLIRRGWASGTSRLLTDAAFRRPEIEFVEIHHDQANSASAGVPRRLGYELIGTFPDEPEAPGECGIECRWRVTRAQWTAR